MKKLISSLFVVAIFALSSVASGHGGMKCAEGKCGGGKCGTSKGMKKAKGNFRAVSKDQAQILQEGKNKAYCPICGMTLSSFYKTNHAADDVKGNTTQYCSIVCAIEDSVVNGKKLSNFRVVDNTTLKFIDSNKAFFVVGSNKPGTMSVISKYAFGTKQAAEKFAKKNGGEVMNFEALYKKVKADLSKDLAATKKRQAKAAKKGKMIYNKMCKKTNHRFKNVADAKSFLTTSGICGKIKGKAHQQVALFLSGRGE